MYITLFLSLSHLVHSLQDMLLHVLGDRLHMGEMPTSLNNPKISCSLGMGLSAPHDIHSIFLADLENTNGKSFFTNDLHKILLAPKYVCITLSLELTIGKERQLQPKTHFFSSGKCKATRNNYTWALKLTCTVCLCLLSTFLYRISCIFMRMIYVFQVQGAICICITCPYSKRLAITITIISANNKMLSPDYPEHNCSWKR